MEQDEVMTMELVLLEVLHGYSKSDISYCYNTGLIKAKLNQAGGISGNTWNSNSLISHCYNIGNVSANSMARSYHWTRTIS